jgi:hypothetical protein
VPKTLLLAYKAETISAMEKKRDLAGRNKKYMVSTI